MEMTSAQNAGEHREGDATGTVDELGAVLYLVRFAMKHMRWLSYGAVAGFLFAIVPVWSRPYMYKATTMFATRSNDAPRSNLSSVASALGISVSAGNQTQSPQFFADLLTSRAVLGKVVQAKFQDPAGGNKLLSVPELFEIKTRNAEEEAEATIDVIASSIRTEVNRNTGTIRVTVSTPWRGVSRELAGTLLAELNAFNLKSLQSVASEERRFVDLRLTIATDSLRATEERMKSFLSSNRQLMNSVELEFTRDRLQRQLVLRQQIAVSLSQALEDARIREVRDTPVISIIEVPVVRTKPESRGRLRRGAYGALGGAFLAFALLFIADIMKRRSARGDPQLQEILRLMEESRIRMLGWVGRRR